MSNAGEKCPRGDGMALAHLMAEDVANDSIDEDLDHLLHQFKRLEGTPRRDNRSSTANPQGRRAPTASASEASTDRRGIQRLAEPSSAWTIAQAAAATGSTTDFMWEPDAESIEATVQSVAEMLQRTANEGARP